MDKHKSGKNILLGMMVVSLFGTAQLQAEVSTQLPPVVVSQPAWDLSNKAEQQAAVKRALGLEPQAALESVSPMPFVHAKELMLETKDGVKLAATYTHTPSQQEAPLVILIHEENGNRHDFDSFAQALRNNGFSTLAMDLRGHGDSRKMVDGTDIRFEDFKQDVDSAAYTQMVFDLEAVLDWAFEHDVVDQQGVFIVASKMGATVGCMAAIPNARRLKGMVMVNVQEYFRKINLKDEVSRVQGLPMLVIASSADPYGQTTPRGLNQVNSEVRPLTLSLNFIGIKLLEQPEAQKEVFQFIRDKTK